ncbi:MAG: hypothetical protein NZM04_06405 [Methylacidiphilales bacterium]|nr:hypothetical protein [Candidatus Methylacidiphilales bacterium]
MNYWLNLFTGTTWKEFLEDGARVSGFRHRMRMAAAKIQPRDILLCYLTGVMRWVGALEVLGPSRDKRPIWKDADFPVRFDVRPLVTLEPEHGVPMAELKGKVLFYASEEDAPGYKAFLRQSPNLFKRTTDGELILELLKQAQQQPIPRPVDPRKLARRPLFRAERRKGRNLVPAVVSVPEPEESEAGVPAEEASTDAAVAPTRHTEIQQMLLALGADMGFNVWVARNDRSKSWQGARLGEMPGMIDELPTQFNEATNRTIELIDVLWLKGNSIVAAFEVECTTSIYSGLLRMSDLLALQPNLEINLYLCAPDERRDKVEQEILRPTFSLREKPLAKVCGFIGFDTLTKKIQVIRKEGLVKSLKADFLQTVAEYFQEENHA